MHNHEIILASSSPRRIALLKNANILFQSVTPDIDEESFIDDSEKPQQIAMRVSLAKAISVAERFSDQLTLGADTIVSFQNKIMGKPKDINEAKHFLKLISGQAHQVITGFTLIQKQLNYAFSDYGITNVYVETLNKQNIDDYVIQENVLDAAGAYKIQGIFSKYITKIDGCYFNVVGLPINKIFKAISQFSQQYKIDNIKSQNF